MKHPFLILAAVYAIASLAWTQSAPAKSATQEKPSEVRMVEIADPLMQMRAGALMIPQDWKFSGTISRLQGCHGHDAQDQWVAQAADGLTAISVYPGYRWNDTQSETMARIMQRNGCPPVDMTKAETFLRQVVLPQLRPSATLDNIEPLGSADQDVLKERVQKIQERADDAARQSMQMGLRHKFRPDLHMLDGARAHLHYTLNGQPVEETIIAVVHCFDVWVPPTYVSQESANRFCNTYPVVVLRAPQGTLAQVGPKLVAIRSSYRVDPAWDYAMAQDSKRQSDEMIAASNRNFAAMMESSRQFFAVQSAKWAADEASRQRSVDMSIAESRAQQNNMDRQAYQWTLFAGDKQIQVNPATGTQYEVSNKYAHSYVSQDGQTVLQSNAPLNPNRIDSNQTYTEMESPH